MRLSIVVENMQQELCEIKLQNAAQFLINLSFKVVRFVTRFT